MNVRIADITRAGFRLTESVPAARLDAMLREAETGYGAREDLTVAVRLSRAGARIIVEGSSATVLDAPCRRCLGSITTPLPHSFRMDLLPASEREVSAAAPADDNTLGEGDSDGSFSLEAADQEYYDGETIDVWSILREQLLLALPDYSLCREDCRGLCQVCGGNLNGGDCGCDRKVADPRWAGLSKIKIT